MRYWDGDMKWVSDGVVGCVYVLIICLGGFCFLGLGENGFLDIVVFVVGI